MGQVVATIILYGIRRYHNGAVATPLLYRKQAQALVFRLSGGVLRLVFPVVVGKIETFAQHTVVGYFNSIQTLGVLVRNELFIEIAQVFSGGAADQFHRFVY